MTFLRTALATTLVSLAFTANASAIVGGSDVPDGERDYVAYISIDGLFACTGTLVSPTYVVTAGHCSSITGAAVATPIGQPGQLIEVTLGSTRRADPDGEKPGVARVVVHPEYIFTNGESNDVALLELETPSEQAPVQVAGRGEQGLWAPGTLAQIAGFGTTESGGDTPDVMQEAEVPITTDEYAADAYAGFENVTQIGAGFPEGGVDTCQGDSGGPLIVGAPDGGLRLVGDTSYGRGCAEPGFPGIYGRVAGDSLREWIRSVAPDAVAPDATTTQARRGSGRRAKAPRPSRGGRLTTGLAPVTLR